MERKGKQKKTARNVIIILCVVLVAVSIPVIMALRKSHSQPTPAETTPTPTAPPAEETVSATPSIELPPYGGYSFDNDELVQLSDCAFVGDSICSGLFVYDVLPKDMVVATGNVGIRSLREYTFDIGGGTYTALEALKVIDPKYVIFSMGMNDINMTSEETYCQNYLSFLADTQAELPSGKALCRHRSRRSMPGRTLPRMIRSTATTLRPRRLLSRQATGLSTSRRTCAMTRAVSTRIAAAVTASTSTSSAIIPC